MVTIKDVAKRAGVSTATVSHVLNRTRVVLPETRESVLEAVRALKYRPSAVARGLITNSTKTIGIVVADVTSPFFAFLLRDIESQLSVQGYNIVVCNTYEQPEREANNLDMLLSSRVDGVILAPTGAPQAIYEQFNEQQIPLIFIDRKPIDAIGIFVGTDNRSASYQATRHLLELGHRRIALTSLRPMTSAVSARIEGYVQALREASIEVDEQLMGDTDYAIETACQVTKDLLAPPDRPTALIASSHVPTLGALQALRQLNLRYPDDLSLVCFDNSEWTSVITPALTVMTKPIGALAHAAVTTLLKILIEQEQRKKNHEPVSEPVVIELLFDSQFIIRESCRQLHQSA